MSWRNLLVSPGVSTVGITFFREKFDTRRFRSYWYWLLFEFHLLLQNRSQTEEESSW